MSESLNDESLNAFNQRLFSLAQTLKIDAWVPENQVMDRVALSFRKLLNFLAQHPSETQQTLLVFPAVHKTRDELVAIVQGIFAEAQQNGVFREDISVALLAQFFTAMLLQMVQIPADPAGRHQQSLAAVRLFCKGAWLGEDFASPED